MTDTLATTTKGEPYLFVTKGSLVVNGNLVGTGDQLRAKDEATLTIDAQDDAAGGWTQGQLVFRDTPLREALTQLQRYRTGPIRLESGPASQLHVSGVFDTAEADRLLDLLPRILDPAPRIPHDPGAIHDVGGVGMGSRYAAYLRLGR